MLVAIVAGTEAPEQVSELRSERRVDPGELGGQFVACAGETEGRHCSDGH